MVTTIAGGTKGNGNGQALESKFGHPRGMAVDTSGNVYVCDFNNNQIRKITPKK